jgi:acylglycerol lipase
MSECQSSFGTFDGLRLGERSWLPPQQACGAVVVLHGFTEHGGRYAPLAEQLCGCGYAVYAPDLRGHGRSEGSRAWIRSFDEYLADVEVYLERIRARQPGRPLFLFGHSMGGTISTLLAVLGRLEVRGLILSAPGVVLGDGVFPWFRRVAPVFGRLFPRLRLFRLGSRMLSRDPRVVEDFRKDPLVYHGRFAVGTGVQILRALGQIADGMERVTVPLLILHGTGDAVTEVEGSRQLCARAASADKTLKLYEGLYHDLLNEPEKESVRADVIEWIRRRT